MPMISLLLPGTGANTMMLLEKVTNADMTSFVMNSLQNMQPSEGLQNQPYFLEWEPRAVNKLHFRSFDFGQSVSVSGVKMWF